MRDKFKYIILICVLVIFYGIYFVLSHKMANDNLILDDTSLKQVLVKANATDCISIDKLIWHFSSIGDKENEQKWERNYKLNKCNK